MKNKERHGCLTAWLVYLIISYTFISLGIFFNTETMMKKIPIGASENELLFVASIMVLNAMFAFMLLKWLKIGFWGILSTSIILFIIKIIDGDNIVNPIITIIFVIILYGLMKLKKNTVSGWDNLE
jgi:hypothetical protein